LGGRLSTKQEEHSLKHSVVNLDVLRTSAARLDDLERHPANVAALTADLGVGLWVVAGAACGASAYSP